MLGLELRHVGVNSGNPEQAMKDAQALAKLLGWPIKDGNSSTFTGANFEFMKKPFRGTHGHIALATNSHRPRPLAFGAERVLRLTTKARTSRTGRCSPSICKDEIAGFAFHLLQK